MKKKFIALIILFVVIVGGYAGLYTYAKTVVIPEQIKSAKKDLAAINNDIGSDNNISSNQSMNGFTNMDISVIPGSERKKIADQMRTNPNQRLNTIDKLSTDSHFVDLYAFMYNLIFMGNAAKDMKDMFATNAQVENSMDSFVDLINIKIPDDIEKGDNKALTADYSRLNELIKENQQMKLEDRIQIQNFITDLGE